MRLLAVQTETITAIVVGLALSLSLAAGPADAKTLRNRSFSDKPRMVGPVVLGAAVLGSAAWIAAHGAPPANAEGVTSLAPPGSPEPFRPGEFTGVVTRITDGDTLWVALPAGSKPVKVRIEGIDAPESCQAWGAEATAALSQRLLNRAVTAKLRALDKYGRRLGKIYDDTEDIGQRMVKDGHAWSIRYRADRGPYIADERMAKALNRGLHANRDAMQPREFRQREGSCKP